MASSVRKLRQPAFPPEAACFTTGQLAQVSGLSRAMADVWVSEGRLIPTRRAKKKGGKGRGRPMFSAIAIFQVRLRLELASHIGFGLSEWAKVGKGLEVTSFPPDVMRNADLADFVAGGNWYWAVARGVENDKPFKFCVYAAYSKRKWLFDASVGDKLTEPCFGLNAPFLFIPAWRIFSDVYVECKKLLGVTDRRMTGEDV
jgi:hypothetical protein